MKSILSKHDTEKKTKRNRMILGGILVFIMFFSVAEYALFGQDPGEDAIQTATDTENYNGFQFSEQNGYWILNVEESSFIFSYNPNEIPRINSIVNPIENYQEKILYLISNNSLANSEIRVNMAQFVDGILETEIENCRQNTIIVKEGNENKITQKENCIYIEGKKEDLIKITDEFLFKLLKITN
ncbi:hypothetical protein HYT25_03570 [Candidatus Pacearchaeota archaeon]|nr:hypothetical protein [Candidatus Pacearchaeota archaeon]